jgi:hypothetical protein
VTRPGVNEEERGRGAGVGGRGRGLQKNDDENFSYCPLSRELHLIQIIHGNFPPHQSDQGSTRKGGVGVLEWGGGGLQKNDDENFSYCPLPGRSRKREGGVQSSRRQITKIFRLK